MNPSIQLLSGIIFFGGLMGCKKETSQPSMTANATVNHPDSHLEWLERVGARLPRENDVPFVFAPMDDNARLEMLLLPMKEAGISLAMPDGINLGNGVWKIAPEDVEKARSIMEKQNLKE